MIHSNNNQSVRLLFKFISLKKILLLSLLIFIGSIFEVMGIGLIGPFISMLLDQDIINTNKYLNFIYERSPNNVKESFVFFYGILLILVFFVVNTFLAFLFYFIEKVARESTADLSINLLKNYFNRDYIFFTQNNSNNLNKNIIIETQQVVHGIVLPILQAFGRLFIIFSILLLLININFKLTLGIITFFFIVFFLIYFIVKNRLREIGIKRSFYDKLKFIISNETIKSIKEAKILKLENFFLKNFSNICYKYAKIHVSVVIYTIFPKYIIEFIVLSLIVFILIYFNSDSLFLQNLPILSIFIFAGYRILPGAQLIYSSISSIKKSQESLNIVIRDLYYEIKDNNLISKNIIEFKKNIIFKNVTFFYDNNKNRIIDNLNLKIEKNDKIALVGKTGSGKSTFIDLLSGLLVPKSGEVLIDDKKLSEKEIDLWQKNLNYLPQKLFFLDKSLEENIAIGSESKDIDQQKIIQSCEFAQLNLIDMNLTLKSNIGENADKLSGGEKQRVGLARLFYNLRNILILDESMNAIDIETETKILRKLMSLNKTIFFVTHDLNHLKLFEKIIFFSEKNIKIGNFEDLIKKDKNFEQIISYTKN